MVVAVVVGLDRVVENVPEEVVRDTLAAYFRKVVGLDRAVGTWKETVAPGAGDTTGAVAQ
jgi:hypothetical protein